MTTQIVITTILAVMQVVAFGSWLNRIGNLKDNLWIEWSVIAVLAMFEYLIWK